MPKQIHWCKTQQCENCVTNTDRGVCSWPWQFVWLGKVESSLTVTSNRSIPFKNTSGRSAVVTCACEITKLFAVAFCVVTVLLKFDFKLVIDGRPNKWRSAEGRSCSDENSCFWHELYVFYTSVKRLYPRSAGQLHSPEYGIVTLCKFRCWIRNGLYYFVKRRKIFQ
jgi:hypothetical protein